METTENLMKVYLLLLITSLLSLEQGSAQYITELSVSSEKHEENQLHAQGFTQIPVDLNKGARGKYIYLWYQQGSGSPITRIQTSFNEGMTRGLSFLGFQKIDKDLNAGAGGDYIYLWFCKGTSEYHIPIVALHVSTEAEEEAQMFQAGWERIGCDLNRKSNGKYIYLWVKREQPTYISDITLSSVFDDNIYHFQAGYNRVDEDTNRGARGSWIYIWYRQTTDCKDSIKDLQILFPSSEKTTEHQGYKALRLDLNKGTGGRMMYLFFKKKLLYGNPVKTVNVIVNRDAVEPYRRAGVQVIVTDLNTGNKGDTMFLCFSQ